ncbi:MAG: alpha-2-macroglobulin family protein [Chloroflexota bacterium]
MSTQSPKSNALRLAPIIILLLLVFGLGALTVYYNGLPERIQRQETLIFGQNRLVPGSQAALRIIVQDSQNEAPKAGARVQVSLRPAQGGQAVTLYTGQTDRNGTVQVAFQVPTQADAAFAGSDSATLIVLTQSNLGSSTLERQVTLQRDYRVLLTTDKPLYQPGQVIHLRALALGAFDLKPAADQEIEIAIADGKGNRVFRKKLTTSAYGVAGVDFQLASQVNTGPYKITAVLANTSSEKTVTVEHYVLPKFDVRLHTERAFYLPGQHVTGSLNAGYFFGKPVAGGQVQLQGYTFDVQQNLIFSLEGATDEQGNFNFEFDLPSYIAGSDLEGGLGRFYLQANVTDLAQHSEVDNLSLPVSASALIVEAIPEGGRFHPGVENILYVLTSYPDGSPAQASLRLNFYDSGQVLQAESGPYGLAEVRLTPASPWQNFTVEAWDQLGNDTQKEFSFEGDNASQGVLLRPGKPVYKVGEAMHLTLLSERPDSTIYLDIVREGQTVSTRSVEVQQGHAEVVIDLTPDLYGTLELHAYQVLSSGSIVRDTRLVVVDNANDLNLLLTPGQETYLPGDPASLQVQVNGQDGGGVQAALGLAIVDESVFALAEQDPGFAKLYFLLEQELLQPRYDLHGYSFPELLDRPVLEDTQLQAAVDSAAQASLAAAAPRAASFSLQGSARQEALSKARQQRSRYFSRLSNALAILLLLLPLAVLGLNAHELWQQKRLWRGLGLLLALLAALVLLILLWPLGDRPWIDTPLDRVGYILDGLLDSEAWLIILLLLGLAGLLVLIVIAWRQREIRLRWSLALWLLYIAIFIAMVYASANTNFSPDEGYVIAGLLAFALLPLSFMLRGAGYAWERRAVPALAAFVFGLFVLAGTLPLLALTVAPRQNAMMAAAPLVLEQAGAVREELLLSNFGGGGPVLDDETLEKKAEGIATGATGGAEPPRLRQYFPETMFWLPEAVTDESGALQLDFPVADSITTWRITALASSQDGRLGSATAGLRVFQDFFIDLDLPLALTVGDEISVPVGVFNYLSETQTVRLELDQAAWFDLLDEPSKEISIASNDISVVYFRVRAKQFGQQAFKVTAWGSQMSDAIQKEVRVFPNGKQITFTQSDRLNPGTPVQQTISIPSEAVPATQSILVKIYPGILSQVVEGLDNILRMPYGCFEQTSSTTYPNVLVLDYLKSTNQASPETQLKAEEYINLGYQRLTTFEVASSGGFSLFGNPPADRMLTAYGLQEFTDMGRVHDVDPALVHRAAEWLLSQQASDGSWENDRGLVHESTWSSLGDDRLPVTAYIVWSLVDAGFGDEGDTRRGVDYVRAAQSQAKDPYVLALVANALVSADLQAGDKLSPETQSVLERLAELAQHDGSGVYWQSQIATFMGSEGQTGSIETTALAALALLRADAYPDLGNAALTYLVRQKDSYGTWYSTQATVLALKALIQSVRAGAEKVDAAVTITLNGGQQRTLRVNRENFDVVQLVAFEDANLGQNVIDIQVQGEGNLMYQVSGSYYLPWDHLSRYPELALGEQLVSIDLAYDRTELTVDDTVSVKVDVTLNQEGGRAESALIDLGLPPGFDVQSEDLSALVAYYKELPEDYAGPKIERFELTGRQILIYISNLSSDQPLSFTYRLRARFPLVALTPASQVYDYYNPEVNGETGPQTLTVNP